ncbi:MAG: primosomal protein N' [Parachlamydiales bacterium]|nr:primosomal protein N' [Parachlamydiales bacterium]
MLSAPVKTYRLFASVILELSINKQLDYGIPEELESTVTKGCLIEVPVRGFMRKGYVASVKTEPSYPKVLPVHRVLGNTHLITEDLFELGLWIAKYYLAPLRQVFRIMLPSSIRNDMQHKQQLFVSRVLTREKIKEYCIAIRNKHSEQAKVLDVMLLVTKGILLTELLEKADVSKSPVDTLVKKGIIAVDLVQQDRSPLLDQEFFATKPKKLNDEQAESLKKIHQTLEQDTFQTHLLFGITGSGKTEVYLQAIELALKQKKSTIMLVPEISLTSQTVERFRSRFKEKIAILHHRLSDGERFDEWHNIRSGKAQIVVGARSAVFCPAQNLGLIIVDEEHENSYKQSEEMPHYHARDVAVMRGMINKACVVLGSATPSLESYYNATQGKYVLSLLTQRPSSATLPDVKIIDMKKEYDKHSGYTSFSEDLIEGLKQRMGRGEQAIVFLNRRGYHTTQMCQTCGHVTGCPNCDVSLTYHLGDHHLACHLCGYQLCPPPKRCTECQSDQTLKFKGVGTEQIERALHAILPDIKTLRIDADTTKHKGSHERLLRDFRTGKADVLIGTQMIAKGLHFPSVSLVGVINCDGSLNLPDFRASETVFQLITQVAGRAGRGCIKGEVIIQTCLPDNPTILHASNQDYNTFYSEEIGVRQAFGYPPFSHLIKFNFSGEDPNEVEIIANQVRNELMKGLPDAFHLHPVIPSGHARVKNRFRFQFLVRGPSVYFLNQKLSPIVEEHMKQKHIHWSVDIDPTSTFF